MYRNVWFFFFFFYCELAFVFLIAYSRSNHHVKTEFYWDKCLYSEPCQSGCIGRKGKAWPHKDSAISPKTYLIIRATTSLRQWPFIGNFNLKPFKCAALKSPQIVFLMYCSQLWHCLNSIFLNLVICFFINSILKFNDSLSIRALFAIFFFNASVTAVLQANSQKHGVNEGLLFQTSPIFNPITVCVWASTIKLYIDLQ